MKHLLFFLLIFAFSFLSFSQDDRKKWSIEAKLTPSLCFSNYKAQKGDQPILQYYADLSQKNAARRPHTVLGVSLQTSYWITNSLRVNGGINYTGSGQQYHSTDFDDAPTVLQVYTEKRKITNHYLGIPVSISKHFLQKEKSSLFATLGCNFNFLILRSQVFTTKLTYHVTGGEATGRNVDYAGRKDILDQGIYNGFSPTLAASFGVCLNTGTKSQLRIGPHAEFMLRPYQSSPIKQYFYNVGLDITYVFANW